MIFNSDLKIDDQFLIKYIEDNGILSKNISIKDYDLLIEYNTCMEIELKNIIFECNYLFNKKKILKDNILKLKYYLKENSLLKESIKKIENKIKIHYIEIENVLIDINIFLSKRKYFEIRNAIRNNRRLMKVISIINKRSF